MCLIEKSSIFKSGKYGGQSVRVQNPAKNYWVVLAVWAGAKSARRQVFSIRINPMDPGCHMLSQKLLVDVGNDPFNNGNQ